MNQIFTKQGKWLIVIAFVAIIFSAASVYATKENRPICNIEGIIKSVKFKDSFFNTDTSVYLLGININSASFGGGDETDFYACQSFYTVGEVREVFIVEDEIKAGDIFSVGQKINGVIHDVGYRAGSLEGMRLGYYTLGTVTPQNKQLEEKTIEPTANPVINNDNGQKEVARKTESNNFLIIGGGIVGFLILLGLLFLFYRKR